MGLEISRRDERSRPGSVEPHVANANPSYSMGNRTVKFKPKKESLHKGGSQREKDDQLTGISNLFSS